jgi:hypothetical protein
MENSLLQDEIVRLHYILNANATSISNICSSDDKRSSPARDSSEESEVKYLIEELIQTKYSLALALSQVEEEKLHRFNIMRAVDSLL